jgi:hypothetical protein
VNQMHMLYYIINTTEKQEIRRNELRETWNSDGQQKLRIKCIIHVHRMTVTVTFWTFTTKWT